MPTPNPSRSKPKSFFDQDKYSAELSSGQLVYGIAILLLFGVACFALGVVVGKFEPAPRVIASKMAAAPGNTSVAPATTSKAPGANRRVKSATPPKPTSSQRPAGDPWTTTSQSGIAKPGTESAKAPVSSASVPDQTGASVSPPGPRHVEKLPAPSGTPLASGNSGAPANPSVDSEIAAKPAPTLPTLDVVEPEDSPLDSTPPVDTTTAADPGTTEGIPPSPNAVSSGQRYTLQVAAVSNRQNAEASRGKIAAKSPHAVELSDSANGKLVIVKVGDFPDRDSAEKARQELIDAGLVTRDSFVTKRYN